MLHNTRLFLAICCFFTTVTVQAQAPSKFGHMNLGNLLESLPETGVANKLLEAYAATYSAKGDSMGLAFETKAAAFQKAYQSGALTPVLAQQQYAAIEKEQAVLQTYQKTAEDAIAAKRDELLNPILTKVFDAIKAVSKENGYAMVFDTSTGAALYALESEDLTSLVKTKLGI